MHQDSYAKTERFTFHSNALSSASASAGKCKVVRFSGTEGFNTLYSFEIQLMSNTPINTSALLATPASLRIERGDNSPVTFHGYPTALSQGGHINGWTFYTVTLQPQFAKLRHIVQNCIYLNKNTQSIVEDALGNCGVMAPKHNFLLHKAYPTHEFSMQYNENVFDFMAFHLERDGIYYYFEQNKDGESIAFTDSPITHTYLEDSRYLRYYPTSGLEVNNTEEVIVSFVMNQVPLPKEIRVRDYDWQKPNLSIEATANVDEQGLGTLFFYGDGFASKAEGQRLADIRAEALQCRAKTFTGTSSVPTISPGYLFTLEDHYDEAFNASYLITDVTHEGSQEAYLSSVLGLTLQHPSDKLYYRNSFTCIPDSVQFRPERRTERKKISGMINAFIDSASDSTMAEIDGLGRYKVIFPHDTSGRGSGTASCWVRRLQPSVGVGYGTSFPLTPGIEVLISFMDGNPDKPFISGALSNAETGYPDNDETTFSGIRTGGGGGVTFNDSPQGQGLNLATGSGRSGFLMASGSMDSAFWQSDYNAHLSTVASNALSSVASSFKSGLNASLSADPSMDTEALLVLALSSITQFMEGFQKPGDTDLAGVESDINKATNTERDAAQKLYGAQASLESANTSYEDAKTEAANAATALEATKNNPNASDTEKTAAQARDNNAQAALKTAQKNKDIAQLKYNTSKNTHTDAEKALKASQGLKGKTQRKSAWNGIVTSLKLLNTAYTVGKNIQEYRKNSPQAVAPYTATLTTQDSKTALKFSVKPTQSRLNTIAGFTTASFIARTYADVMQHCKGGSILEQDEKKLQTERDTAKLAFHDKEDAYLKEAEFQRLRQERVEAIMQEESISEERANIKVSLEETDLKAQADANLNALNASAKDERLDALQKRYYESIDASYKHKLQQKKEAYAHSILASKTPELIAEFVALLTMWKNTTPSTETYGGLKLDSTQNIVVNTAQHSYMAAEKGISLLSLPVSSLYPNAVPAPTLEETHHNFHGIDKSKTFIAAESEQIRIVGLENTDILGTTTLNMKSAQTVTITNLFNDKATHQDPLCASLNKFNPHSAKLIAFNAAAATLQALAGGDPTQIAEAQAVHDKAQQALIAEQALTTKLTALTLTEAHANITLDNATAQQSLSLENTGKTLSLKQVALDDGQSNTLQVSFVKADKTTCLGTLSVDKSQVMLAYNAAGVAAGHADKQSTLTLNNDAAKLSYGTNSTLLLKADSFALADSSKNDPQHSIKAETDGIFIKSKKKVIIISNDSIFQTANNTFNISGKKGTVIKGGDTTLKLNNGTYTINSKMIQIG